MDAVSSGCSVTVWVTVTTGSDGVALASGVSSDASPQLVNTNPAANSTTAADRIEVFAGIPASHRVIAGVDFGHRADRRGDVAIRAITPVSANQCNGATRQQWLASS